MTLVVEMEFFASSESIFHWFAQFIVDLSLFNILFRDDLFNQSIHSCRNHHRLRWSIFIDIEFIPNYRNDQIDLHICLLMTTKVRITLQIERRTRFSDIDKWEIDESCSTKFDNRGSSSFFTTSEPIRSKNWNDFDSWWRSSPADGWMRNVKKQSREIWKDRWNFCQTELLLIRRTVT